MFSNRNEKGPSYCCRIIRDGIRFECMPGTKHFICGMDNFMIEVTQDAKVQLIVSSSLSQNNTFFSYENLF